MFAVVRQHRLFALALFGLRLGRSLLADLGRLAAAEDAVHRERARLDYVGIGGIYATTSKTGGKSPIGIEGLARVVRVFRDRIGNFPTCGISGITVANAEPVIAAGADGVAVISALSHARDPAAAARELRAVVDSALTKYAPKVPAVGVASDGGGAAEEAR